MKGTRLDDPGLARIETRRSVLYLGERDVWKQRKPEAWGMRSAPSPDARRRACLREWRLNRELAAGVYRGPVAITRAASGLRLGGNGPAEDWALHMRRLAEGDRLDVRIERGALRNKAIRRVARRLAAFHERAARTAAPAGDPADGLRRLAALRFSEEELSRELREAEDRQRAFVDRHAGRFQARAAAGAVRAGHGELVLDHVFVDDELDVQMIARLDWGSGLARMDVCADVATLANDLAAAGRSDLGERFLAEYARHSNDFALYELVDFYASLGAAGRAKFEAWCTERFVREPGARARGSERARRYALLAGATQLSPMLPPVVVAMGGQVASGKSTAAKWLARRIGAPIVSTDRTRDFLLGARLNEELHEFHWERAYDPGFGRRVYGEVMDRAARVLGSGRPVVLDGCFRSVENRRSARALAEKHGLPFLFVEARVSRSRQRARLLARSKRDGEPPSTWLDIADTMRREWQPARELADDEHLVIDMMKSKRATLALIKNRLPLWPKALHG